jgi:hypothetical protein
VIVDHFSEMPDATRQEIRPGQSDFPANVLIITSRLEEQLGGVPPSTVKPLRIQGNRLSSFLEAYLTQRGKREYFDDAEFFDACRRLSLMVGTRDITVLLAKLYAEQMIAAKEGPAESILPDTIPDLMLSYVNEVNRGVDRPKRHCQLNADICETARSSGTIILFRGYFMPVSGMAELYKCHLEARSGRSFTAHPLS